MAVPRVCERLEQAKRKEYINQQFENLNSNDITEYLCFLLFNFFLKS